MPAGRDKRRGPGGGEGPARFSPAARLRVQPGVRIGTHAKPLLGTVGPVGASTLRLVAAAAVLLICLALLCPFLILTFPWRGVRAWLTGHASRLVGRLSLAAAGVSLRVEGLEHRDVGGPAILAINHRSGLDLPLVMAVMPDRPAAIGKREVVWIPIFGQAYWLSGGLLLDRTNHAEAVAAMARVAVQVRRFGLSPVMSPEGTRSRDGGLLPFKRGIVHLAVATGLPVLPLLLSGAAERWPLGAFAIQPGPVQARFLPRIDTSSWRVEDAGTHADALRAVFLEGLADLDGRPRS